MLQNGEIVNLGTMFEHPTDGLIILLESVKFWTQETYKGYQIFIINESRYRSFNCWYLGKCKKV